MVTVLAGVTRAAVSVPAVVAMETEETAVTKEVVAMLAVVMATLVVMAEVVATLTAVVTKDSVVAGAGVVSMVTELVDGAMEMGVDDVCGTSSPDGVLGSGLAGVSVITG